MVHFHNFNHMKIDWFPPLVLGVCDSSGKGSPGKPSGKSRTFRWGRRPDSHHGIDHRFGKLLRQGSIEFCGERRFRQADESGTV
jgi:hypothetical protein